MAYSKINWENLPSTNTPINATNLNKMDTQIKQNETDIAANASDIATNTASITQMQKIMTITLSADVTTSTAGKIALNKVFFDNTDGALTLSNNGIKIGAGVSQVLVSGQCFAQRLNSSGAYIWTHIDKNSTVVNYAIADYSGDYGSTVHTETPLNVEEDDLITLNRQTAYNNTIRKEPNTMLTVKIIK